LTTPLSLRKGQIICGVFVSPTVLGLAHHNQIWFALSLMIVRFIIVIQGRGSDGLINRGFVWSC